MKTFWMNREEVVEAWLRDRQRLRRVLGMGKKHRDWHLAWKVTAEYLFSLLNAGYELQDKLETERNELRALIDHYSKDAHRQALELDSTRQGRNRVEIIRDELQRRLDTEERKT